MAQSFGSRAIAGGTYWGMQNTVTDLVERLDHKTL
jgi:hypothetical protein